MRPRVKLACQPVLLPYRLSRRYEPLRDPPNERHRLVGEGKYERLVRMQMHQRPQALLPEAVGHQILDEKVHDALLHLSLRYLTGIMCGWSTTSGPVEEPKRAQKLYEVAWQ